MFSFFIDRPILSTVIAVLVTLGGALAAVGLPVAQYPDIVPPQVQVTTAFPGANAEVVAQSIAAPIEEQVNGTEGMLYMSSRSSNDGVYTLTVTFEVGTDPDLAAVDVQNRVSVAQSSLPADVIRQGVTVRKQSNNFLQVLSLSSPDGRYDDIFLSNYARLNVQDAIARVPGVGQVQNFGGRTYAMRLWLDADRMAQLGITPRDVVSVVQEQNVVAPAGGIGRPPAEVGQELQYSVLVQGRLSEVSEYEDIVVRATPDGRVVRLGDVARIELASVDYSSAAHENGKEAVFVGVFLQPGGNALSTAQGVEETMNRLAETFPPGLEWSKPYDTVPFVRESLSEVWLTLGIAFVLVTLVVFVFLQSWRATLIPLLVVPVSLVGTFAAFAALGFFIHQLTLFALVLAIGIVVDDAIVVVEAVQHRLDTDRGTTPKEAAKAAMKEVGGPVIAIALVLAAVFVPTAFVGGLTGELYRQFALTIAVSVMISAVAALTFTPALSALLLRPVDRSRRRRGPLVLFDLFDRGYDALARTYSAGVARLVRHAVIAIVLFGVMIGGTYWLVDSRPAGLVPDEDQGYLIAVAQLPPGASLERTEAITNQMDRAILETPGVRSVGSIAGFNLLTGLAVSYSTTTFILLEPFHERDEAETAQAIAGGLMGRLNGELHDANVLVLAPPPIQGLGQAGGFTFVLQDRANASPERFAEVAQGLVGAANARPEIAFAFTGYDPRIPRVELDIDRDKVKAQGVDLDEIFFTLQTYLGGYYVNDFNLYGRTFRVQAQAEAEQRSDPDDIDHFHVRNAEGEMVPLGTLVSNRITNGPEYTERYNLFRSVTINGSAAPGYSSSQAIEAMEALAADLPPGFGYEWSEATFQERQSQGQNVIVFAISLLFVFLVLAALYESWSMPVAILLVIPFGVLGAFLGIALRDLANDVYTQIALIMLIGLAAKNAILIVEFAKLARERGMGIVAAAMEGARLRLRPILMTSFAFILGGLPLAIATGAGAGARTSLGTAVVFGMGVATLVGVFFVPVFYVLLARVSERRWPFARRPEDDRIEAESG
jgi:hydrophobe/amphiphile efflux-1 (HAE1) family protein